MVARDACGCSTILHTAKQIIKDNGFEEQITLIQAKMEDLELPCKVRSVAGGLILCWRSL